MSEVRGQAINELIIGESRAIREVRGIVNFAAAANASVLITGPSGTGKELVAQGLHYASRRATRDFVAVNCGAIPRELIESELFGHEKGSFTGAVNRRIGHFEKADSGTLFLDEIGDMPIDMQVRLLRVLEDRKICRVGSGNPVKVDVRMIAATHQCLETAIAQKRFREDLFYRLAVLPIELPSLAERMEDVPILIDHFLSQGFVADAPPRFAADAMRIMMAHDWPGNVRELRNLVERAAVFFPGQEIGSEQISMLLKPSLSGRTVAADASTEDRTAANQDRALSSFGGKAFDVPGAAPAQFGANGPAVPFKLKDYLQDEEKRVLLAALECADGIVSSAARMVSLNRTTFIEKMKRYQIDRDYALAS